MIISAPVLQSDMRISTTFVSFSILVSSAVAFPWKARSFIPPTDSDSRTPCPGLNVLANEGVLCVPGLDSFVYS